MREERYANDHGVTAACAFRMAEGVEYSGDNGGDNTGQSTARAAKKAERYYGDSWFASVSVAIWFAKRGHAFVGAVKTSSRLFPKTALEERMKHYPSGASLVLECEVPGEDIKLLAIGYKYNKKKVLLFVATKNAGSTLP